jgi:uncharacterized membrane protein
LISSAPKTQTKSNSILCQALSGPAIHEDKAITMPMSTPIDRWIRAATWLLFAAIIYLIFTEAVGHWIRLPGLGNIGFTLVFVLFSLVHCVACNGWRKTAVFFILAAVVSYALEEIGVRTGWIYGAYHYSNMLGPKLGHVPILIPLAWFMMIYASWEVARGLLRGVDIYSARGMAAQAIVAAMVMTAWDTVMDPGMAAAGNWIWEQGGGYFGVPLQNYFGWLLTTFLVYLAAGWLWSRARVIADARDKFTAMPIIVYAFYGVSYTMPRRIPALQVVALFAMVMPASVALLQFWLAAGPPARLNTVRA